MPEIIVKLGDNIVQKYFFFQEPLNIGRSPENEIVIENLAISRNHATICFENGRYFISDLDSSNGTFVNGVRVKKTEVMDKDVVTVGKHKLYFYDQRTTDVVHKPSLQDNDSTMLVDHEPELEATLVINKGRQKGQHFILANGQTTLGRGSENDVRLTDWFVSKQHAQIERREKKFVIRDLGSWRHTFVNGEAVEEAPLHPGDVIQLGPTVEMLFEIKSEQPAQRPANRVPHEMQAASQSAAPMAAPQSSSQPSLQSPPDSAESHGTSSLPLDQLHLEPYPGEASDAGAIDAAANPFDELNDTPDRADAESQATDDGQPQPEVFLQGDDPDWLCTGRLPLDNVIEPASDGDRQSSAAAAAPDSDDAQQAADKSGSPLLHSVVDSRDDQADAVYEDLAEASLLAAADAATAKSAAGGTASENRVDSAPVALNDAEEGDSAQADDVRRREVEMWERALQNKSQVIRKQAARRLKQLTGRDYDY